MTRRRDELWEGSKQWLRATLRRRPILHRVAKEALVGYKLMRRRLVRRDTAPVHSWGQRVPRYEIPFAGRDLAALRAEFDAHAIVTAEGRHTLYLPPQPGRAAVFGAEFLAAYPSDAGITLLKDFQPPSRAGYQFEVGGSAQAALHGPIGNQLFAAAGLYAYQLGPRPYDLVHLAGSRTELTAIVGEHVEGRTPTESEYEQFIVELRALERRKLFSFAAPSRFDNPDFTGPHCNHNLITGPAGPRYVDSEAFLFESEVVADLVGQHADALHFGDVLTVVNAGDRFLYQEVPGLAGPARRGTAERWLAIDALFRRQAVELRGRVVFDICCNSGMMMHGSLVRGADWAFGWDLPAVADAADALLPLIGFGRTTLFGRQLGAETDFRGDLPDWILARLADAGGVALFLAAWHHIGFPAGIGDLPWTLLVYEGMENEVPEQLETNVATMSERWRAKEVERYIIRDGICGPRPVVLLRRVG